MKKATLYILLALSLSRCAQITPLTGGKKDATPPKVLSALPANASVNFNSKQIVIQFNEYIQLRDITNQFIITPQTKELPDIEAQGKILKINFTESLLPNTTYKLAFGNAIVDLHEGNAISNFEYVFSTGNIIDSLKLTGKIINATNKKVAANLLVGLYSSLANDSIVYKEKPLYITRTTTDGYYEFNYLPTNSFKLVAIDDANKNLMYDGSNEQIAFLNNPANPSDSAKQELLLFKETPSKQFIKKTTSNEYGKALIIYNKPCNDITTITWKKMEGVYHINDLQDSLTVYYKNAFDTLEVIVHRSTKSDTLTLKIPSLIEYEKLKKNNRLKYLINSNLASSFPYYETPSIQLNFPFNEEEIQKEKITCYKLIDSIKIKQPYEIIANEKQVNAFYIKTKLEKETLYQITISKGAFTDFTGKANDSLDVKFKTTTPDDYAQLNIKLLFPKKENYIVLLLNEKEQLVAKQFISFSLASTNEKILNFTNLLPGNYFVRVVEDVNKNNGFDTGNFLMKLQPEIIYINQLPIKLLAGWEIESEWNIK